VEWRHTILHVHYLHFYFNLADTDFKVQQRLIVLTPGQLSTTVYVEHTMDGVAQEGEEQYTLSVSNVWGLQSYSMVGTTITIVDSDSKLIKF